MHLTRSSRLQSLVAGLLLLAACESATSLSGGEYLLEVVAPTTTQSAIVLSATPTAPTVRVTTASGSPVGGIVVAFAPVGGGGVVQQRVDTTGADGTATALQWTLGARAGAQELRAFLPATTNDEFATFTATATPALAATMSVVPDFGGLVLGDSTQLVLSFRDAFLNVATAPAPPTFTSSDTLIVRVSAAGRARAVGLGFAVVTVTSGTLTGVVSLGVSAGSPTMDVDSFPGSVASGFAISSAGIAYLSSPSNGWIKRFDVSAGTLTDSLEIGFATADVAFDAAGTIAYVAAHPGSIHVVDVATNTQLRSISLPSFPMRLLVSPDGAWLYATLEAGAVLRINTTTDLIATVSHTSQPNGMALNAAGDRLYVSSMQGSLRTYALPAFAQVSGTNPLGQPEGLALSPGGDRLFLARETDTLEVRRSSNLSRITIATGVTSAYSVAITPDGNYLVVASKTQGTLRILDAYTLQVHHTYPASAVRRLAVDPSTGDIWVSFDTPQLVRLRFP